MQKVVIDTNVIVSSLIQNSYPYLILNELFIEGKFDLCVSKQVMAEYYEVLARPKLKNFKTSLFAQKLYLPTLKQKQKSIFPQLQ